VRNIVYAASDFDAPFGGSTRCAAPRQFEKFLLDEVLVEGARRSRLLFVRAGVEIRMPTTVIAHGVERPIASRSPRSNSTP
jgi:hypothetical protein